LFRFLSGEQLLLRLFGGKLLLFCFFSGELLSLLGLCHLFLQLFELIDSILTFNLSDLLLLAGEFRILLVQ